jgi:hypothetical protein
MDCGGSGERPRASAAFILIKELEGGRESSRQIWGFILVIRVPALLAQETPHWDSSGSSETLLLKQLAYGEDVNACLTQRQLKQPLLMSNLIVKG